MLALMTQVKPNHTLFDFCWKLSSKNNEMLYVHYKMTESNYEHGGGF